MKKILQFICLLMLICSSLMAKATNELIVENLWVRAAPPAAKVLAAYMTLNNKTDQDAIIVGAKSDLFEHIMFHNTIMENGVAKMRHSDEIIIPANDRFELAPGGFHLMMMGKKAVIKPGDKVELTLQFKNGEEQTLIAPVKKTASD